MYIRPAEWNADGTAAEKRPIALSLFHLMRPRQWVKNGFVLAPLIFSRSFQSLAHVNEAVIALAAFCLASSAGYVVNDINDREADRLHPEKRHSRPLAAGEVTLTQALVLLALLVSGVALLLCLLPALTPALLFYMALTFTYSVALKKIAVLDLFAIALGFVLRVYAGACAIGVPLTFWMSITTLCLALYLAAIKRKQELVQNGASARGVLQSYTPELLSGYAQIGAVTSVVFYALYVATVRTTLVYSLPLVLVGIFRYQLLAEMKGKGQSPSDVLMADPMLLGTVAVWGCLSIILLI